MAPILSFYFTLKENTSKETIRKLVNSWVQTGQYYDFEEAILSEDELESAVRSVKGDNQSVLSYCQAYDSQKKERYLAFRLETKDSSNLTWTADVIFRESENQSPSLLVNLSRNITAPGQPADCSQRIKYPSLIKLLFDQDIVSHNTPLSTGKLQKVSSLAESDADMLQRVSKKEVRTESPLLFVHAPNLDLDKQNEYLQENLDLSIQTVLQSSSDGNTPYWTNADELLRILCIFSRVMHVYVADSEEETGFLNQFNTSPSGEDFYIEFVYPWLNLNSHISLKQFSDFKQLYQHMIFLLQSCRQGQDPFFPDWNRLQDLITLSEAEDSSESYYLHMNQNIANAMQIRRKELHLTQGDLAEKIGTTKMLISRLERLQTIKVRRRMIRQLEAALSLAPGSLEKLSMSDVNAAPIGFITNNRTFENNQTQPVSIQPAFCHMCGKPLLSEGRYCRWCGTKL